MNELLSKNSQAVDFDPFAGIEIETTIPTTEPQKEIWLSSQLGPDASCAYNESLSLELVGNLNLEGLEFALNQVTARHDALRATISADGESLCIAKALHIALPLEDWSQLPIDTRRHDLEAIKQREVSTPFDLLNGPLLRARLIRLAPEQHVILLSAHHIICDGWSFEPLLSDFSAFYSAAISATEPNLAPADSLASYVARHSDAEYLEDITRAQDYWLQRFRNVPRQTEFLPDRIRPAQRTFDAERIDWPLPTALIQQLKELGASHRCSLMTTLMSGFEVFVSRLTGQRDLVIGVPSAGQLAFDCPNLIGHCVNLLPIRTHIEPRLRFSEYLSSRRSQMLSDFEHQNFTYGSLLKSLQLERDPSRMPLTSIMFNIDQPIEGIKFAGLKHRISSNMRRFEAFEQFFNLSLGNTDAVIECQFNTNLFDSDLMKHRLEAFQSLLEAMVTDPEQTIGDMNLLSARQKTLVLKDWCRGPDREAPYPSCIQRFNIAVAEYGERPAIRFDTRTLSYLEVDQLSTRLSQTLGVRGIGPGDRVGILLRRSENLPVCMLGVLKSGAAYVPLDPELPVERLAYISADSGVSLIICEPDLQSQVQGAPETALFETLVKGAPVAASEEASPSPEMPAYVIYTSGSTGKPKGVEVTHGNLVNLLNSMTDKPGIESDDRLLAITTPSFDISILELLGPIMVGAEVVVADAEAVRDATRLIELLKYVSPTIMQATPSTWRMIREAGWQGNHDLKVLCGGEALDSELSSWLSSVSKSLWNMYGPTETTIWSTCRQLRADQPVTLGFPISNTQVYVLNDRRGLLPPGSPGELYIGGLGVARGYWNRTDLTAERFIDNPFGDHRLYRTGDSVRFLADGDLEYLGRLDSQVKVRGYRIELGEIETALVNHENVAKAVVSVYEPTPGDVRLAAYCVPRVGCLVEASKLRKHLLNILPLYMIPQHFVEISDIPLTPSRKVDRKALPSPMAAASNENRFIEPSSEAEILLGEVWSDVLGIERISVNDDFFDLGGHSILATRVVAKLTERTGVVLPLRRLFSSPELKSLAEHLDALMALKKSTADNDEHDVAREEISF